MKKICVFLLVCLLSMPLFAFSQVLNIDGDTIKVSADAFSSISFPDEIKDVKILCGAQNYDFPFDGDKLIIKPRVSKPISPCEIAVTEGTGKNARNHRFILIFISRPEEFEHYHDLHTTELIQARIDYLKSTEARASADKNPPTSGISRPVPINQQSKTDDEVIISNDDQFINLGGNRIPRTELEKQIEFKTNLLRKTLVALCSKTGNDKKWIDFGMELFNNDTSRTVEVSSKKVNTHDAIKIKKYLTKMSQLKFDHVDIQWRQGIYISNLVPQPDGTWQGIVAIEEVFVARSGTEGSYVYKDVAKKKISYTVKVYHSYEDGKEHMAFDVFLGNMSVSETMK